MPSFRVERELRKKGYELVAGLDEAGRGAWAGPLYAAAVILPLDEAETILQLKSEGVRDGKRVSPNRRERLRGLIEELAVDFGVGWASAQEVDEMRVVRATQLAMERALEKLPHQPDYLLIDGRYLSLPDVGLPQDSLSRGEWQARCIAAASIVAKVERDRHMRQLDERWPGYGFAQHKGYGTAAHRAALKSLRPCAEHRFSFRPVAELNSARP